MAHVNEGSQVLPATRAFIYNENELCLLPLGRYTPLSSLLRWPRQQRKAKSIGLASVRRSLCPTAEEPVPKQP